MLNKDYSKQAAYLTGTRDAPDISTLPPDVAFFAVKKAIPLLQELRNICTGIKNN